MSNQQNENSAALGRSDSKALLGSLDSASMPQRPGRILGIFKQLGLWAKLEFIFWRTLCTRPDGTRLGMWWYGVSGRIAGFFHKKRCDRCASKYGA
jgi:hypothetical protein